MKKVEIEILENWFDLNYQKKIQGRRIVLKDILPLVGKLKQKFKIKTIGQSHLKNDIYSITIGNGTKKVLIWTQMHGNESTGTKALFDLFEFFTGKHKLSNIAESILKECTITCIPILNPDGAIAYTRVNAQNIDLNRDVIDKKAIESRILQEILKQLQPEYCFNMHDQRTIFSVGKENNPATISFLAPSVDKQRSLTEGRKRTMEVIVSMYELLQKIIPNQIGRYTDEFYPTATGDNFQKMGHNTILIESGHYKDDYLREKTRKYTFFSLLQGLNFIANNKEEANYEAYFKIPNNNKNYLDVILKDISYKNKKVDVGVLFEERLKDNKIFFIPKVDKIDNLSNFNANKIISNLSLSFSDEEKMNTWIENEFN
ncbi:MAG: zinc carboxypeptidase [Flavobacteriaceae bacterium]|nr:zinc carboxypeptidase [Flavobacteriaceae bacterium]